MIDRAEDPKGAVARPQRIVGPGGAEVGAKRGRSLGAMTAWQPLRRTGFESHWSGALQRQWLW